MVRTTFAIPVDHTIGSVLSAAREYLEAHDVINPDWHAELLVGGHLGMARHEVHLKRAEPIEADNLHDIAMAIDRRAAGEPTQYILGETEFYGLRLRTDRRALIPRPETELLVDAAKRFAQDVKATPVSIIDLGTGSGCVAVALATSLQNAKIIATDISPDALELAAENARLHNVEQYIEFRISNLFEQVSERAHLIVGNLPYVATTDRETLPREVQAYEPPGALFAGPDGLAVLTRAIRAAPDHLHPGGRLALEIGYDQADAIRELAGSVDRLTDIELLPDYAGHLRVLVARKA